MDAMEPEYSSVEPENERQRVFVRAATDEISNANPS
jgi:hypothetical protein